jgi:3-hydroxyisobutyrate dehydrogenase-like beta-hydroxyacid dehydrogenase
MQRLSSQDAAFLDVEDAVWADLSTISPDVSRKLAARVLDEGHGALMLDTPVSGSVPQVQTGTLTIMVGGDEDAYRRVEPVLRVLGTPEYVGENGQGLVLKLAINISLAVQMLAFAEGLLLAERDGIDAHRAAEIMTESAIGSPMLKARVPLVLDKPDGTWFDVELMHKDVRLARQAGEELVSPLPTAAVADEILDAADQLGYGHRDIAALYEVLAKLPPKKRPPADVHRKPTPMVEPTKLRAPSTASAVANRARG